jgi:glycosyltransferase involved in cell wall biosynthesis
LKILFFNWRDITHPQAGGCELHLHEIAKRIVKKGHEVTLFCGSFPNAKKTEIIDGIKIIRKGSKYTVYIHAFFTYLTYLRKKKYDIIIDDINGIAFFTPVYIYKPKIAIIHHLVKDIFSKELPIYFRPIGYFAEWLIPIFYKNIEFITVSQSSKEEMSEIGIDENRIQIIHNGISSKYKANLEMKTENPTLCYIGRLKEYKQLDHLIKSINFVKEKFPKIKLSIAGSGDTEEELKKLVKKLHLEETVTFHGFINEEDKISLYQQSWAFVNPSLKEGWGLTSIEANACGTPAIAYDVPGLKESIKDNFSGLLVEKIDYHHLSKKIIEFLANDLLREKLTKNALTWADNFSWDKSSTDFLDFLENVFKNN